MYTSLKLSLDKRRKRKDSTFPIIMRLTHLGNSTSISLGHYVQEKFWDGNKQKIKNSYKGVQSVNALNSLILREIALARDIINKLEDKGQLHLLSLSQVNEKIAKKSKYDSFYEYGYSLVEELKLANRYGTARAYSGLLGILKVLTKNNDLKFNELNYDFLKKFERFHLSKNNNTINGLASYMRVLKAIYNKGIKEGIIEKEAYPFDKFKIKTTPTEKRAIDLSYIKKILELKLNKDNVLYDYRNYFLISYMLYGMSFIDMAFLKIENIIDGRIKFQRRKTSKPYNIKITKQLEETLKIYSKGKSKEDFIFPIIKREDLELQYKDIDWARKRYNKGLKEIAELCNIDQRLTSYVSRHSFATQAMLQNVPLQAISAMLGHSKLNTTQIYLKSLPNELLDKYNEQINMF